MTDTEIRRELRKKLSPQARANARRSHQKFLARQRWGHDLEGRIRWHQEKIDIMLELLAEAG